MGVIKGFIDTVNDALIRGWVFEEGVEAPVSVKIYIDGELITSDAVANFHRPGILQKGMHPTGNCEFQVIPPKNVLKKNSIVRVFAGEENLELKKSPWVYDAEGHRVLIVGLAKSGTSILTYRIAEAIEGSKVFFEPNGAKGLNDVRLHLSICNHEKAVTKCLFPWHDELENFERISRLYEKKIWIIRDPRDNIISNYLYMWNPSYNAPREKFDAALKMTQEKENNPASIPFHKLFETLGDPYKFVTRQYDAILRQVGKIKDEWHILKYEDLVSENLAELNGYLGVEVSTNAKVPEKLNRVVRSKKSGNWRDWFTEEDIAFYKPIIDKYLEFFNYDINDWELNNLSQLPSEKGSEYMNTLYHSTI